MQQSDRESVWARTEAAFLVTRRDHWHFRLLSQSRLTIKCARCVAAWIENKI